MRRPSSTQRPPYMLPSVGEPCSLTYASISSGLMPSKGSAASVVPVTFLQNSSISCAHKASATTGRVGQKAAAAGSGGPKSVRGVRRARPLHRRSPPRNCNHAHPRLHAAKGVGRAPRHQHALARKQQGRRLVPLLLKLPLALLYRLQGRGQPALSAPARPPSRARCKRRTTAATVAALARRRLNNAVRGG